MYHENIEEIEELFEEITVQFEQFILGIILKSLKAINEEHGTPDLWHQPSGKRNSSEQPPLSL